MNLPGMRIALLLLLTYCTVFCSYAKPLLKTVNVGFSEGFSTIDSMASQRYKDNYEAAIYYSLGKNESRLNNCGYKYKIFKEYFEATNFDSVKLSISKLSKENVWIVFGASRGDPFRVSIINNKVFVSPMAEDDNIYFSNKLAFNMSSGNNNLAFYAVKSLQKLNYGTNYGIFIDSTCSDCISFSKYFNKYATENGLKKSFELYSISDTPDLTNLIKMISQNKIDFLVLPNYSKFSGYVISHLHKKFPSIKFVGSDGWGKGIWSFFPDLLTQTKDAQGLSVRQSCDVENINSLNITLNGNDIPPSCVAVYIVKFFDILTDDICKYKPDNVDDFNKIYFKFRKDHFLANHKISLLSIKNGMLKLNNNYEI